MQGGVLQVVFWLVTVRLYLESMQVGVLQVLFWDAVWGAVGGGRVLFGALFREKGGGCWRFWCAIIGMI